MIGVIGLGFVGLTTALGFADKGHKVLGIDVDKQRTNSLLSGNIDFKEPYLKTILQDNLNNRLCLKSEIDESINECEYIFICVGTPEKEDGSVDLSYVKKACFNVVEQIKDTTEKKYIIIKSTVPPGSCVQVQDYLNTNFSNISNVCICSNPEFLREGHCWEDFIKPGRIIIGADSESDAKQIAKLYEDFETNLFLCTLKEAEFSKYLSNVMLASLISMSNEFANAALHFGDIDIKKVFRALHCDERLNNSGIAPYIYPGCGFGGYCLPKDTAAFLSALNNTGMKSEFFESVIDINNKASNRVVDYIVDNYDTTTNIGILGLSFKPNSDDVRNTPSAKIICSLLDNGFNNIFAYDPIAIDSYKNSYPEHNIVYNVSTKELLGKCDVVIVVTAWDEFKEVDYSSVDLIDARYCI